MMRDIPFVDVDYCQFSDWGYQKPTRFWGSANLGELPHVKCPGNSCKYVSQTLHGSQHLERLGGNEMHYNTAMKGRIPPKVIDYLIRDGEYAPSRLPKSKLKFRQKGYKVDPKIRLKILRDLQVTLIEFVLTFLPARKMPRRSCF